LSFKRVILWRPTMATARPSFTKRQRETAKRERKELKAAKRAARKNNSNLNGTDSLDLSEEAPPENQ